MSSVLIIDFWFNERVTVPCQKKFYSRPIYSGSPAKKKSARAFWRNIEVQTMLIDTHQLGVKWEDTEDTKGWSWSSAKPYPRWKNLVWTQDPRLPTKLSFKGGSPPIHTPNPTLFLAFPQILRTRFLLRVVVCHIPKFWNVKRIEIGSVFDFLGLKFHKDLKLFENFILISNFQNFVFKNQS